MRLCVINHPSMIGLTRKFIVAIPHFGNHRGAYVNEVCSLPDGHQDIIRARHEEHHDGYTWMEVVAVYGDKETKGHYISTHDIDGFSLGDIYHSETWGRNVSPAIAKWLDCEIERDLTSIASRSKIK